MSIRARHVFALALLVSAAASLAQTAVRPPQMRLEVKRKSDSDTEQSSSRYGGSFSKAQEKALELTMTVRNLERTTQSVVLAWYYVANPLDSKFDNYIYDKGTQNLSLAPSTFAAVTNKSKTLESSMKGSRHSATVKTGAKPFGYIVTLGSTSAVWQVIASPSSLEKAARSTNEMAKLLSAPAIP